MDSPLEIRFLEKVPAELLAQACVLAGQEMHYHLDDESNSYEKNCEYYHVRLSKLYGSPPILYTKILALEKTDRFTIWIGGSRELTSTALETLSRYQLAIGRHLSSLCKNQEKFDMENYGN